MVGPYKEKGTGTIWIGEEDKEKLIEKIKEHEDFEEELLGSFESESFDTDEIYVDTHGGRPELVVTGTIGEVFVDVNVPIKNTPEMGRIVRDLLKVVSISTEESGLFLKPDDFEEVRIKTTDGQGRINLGSRRAGKDVRVVVMEVKPSERD